MCRVAIGCDVWESDTCRFHHGVLGTDWTNPARARPVLMVAAAAGSTKRNTPDSPHVLAALRQISAGQITVAEASIQYDIPIPTLYVNMRRQGVKARGRVGMAGEISLLFGWRCGK